MKHHSWLLKLLLIIFQQSRPQCCILALLSEHVYFIGSSPEKSQRKKKYSLVATAFLLREINNSLNRAAGNSLSHVFQRLFQYFSDRYTFSSCEINIYGGRLADELTTFKTLLEL